MTGPRFHPIDLILKKRDGQELTQEQIEQFVRAVVENGESKLPGRSGTPSNPPQKSISDAQIGAFLMAVFHHGLTRNELSYLTTAMRSSGEQLQHGDSGAFVVDKHSTGGVGDKSSMIIAPVLAAAGCEQHRIVVPMIAGRSLGHTGGTLDKLETIPGFDCQLSLNQATEVLGQCNAFIMGQTPALVPADRMLYAMRDHTGTVESPFLITASIMSKKLAENLDALILDVKVGSGAFMPTYQLSRLLADLMVSTGELAGTRTVALLTSMEEPLGRFSGNWVEVWECVDIMKGKRHPMSSDLIELSNSLAGWMLYLAGKAGTPEQGAQLSDRLLASGHAFAAWCRLVKAQGGDTRVFERPEAFHEPVLTKVFTAPADGFLASMNCKEVGWAVQRLGAGRDRPGAPVSSHAGIESHVKLGDLVRAGQPMYTLFADQASQIDEGFSILQNNVHVAPVPPPKTPLVREVVRQA